MKTVFLFLILLSTKLLFFLLISGCDLLLTPVNSPPKASFSILQINESTQIVYVFDASSSKDEEDNTASLKVRWDWESDGMWDTKFTTAKTDSHTYFTSDTVRITLEVKDSEGKNGYATKTLYVSNTPPGADFMVNLLLGDVATKFIFDANICTDQEDPAEDLKVRWDWENDGIWDIGFTTAKIDSHTYSTDGMKTIKLEVEDTGGLRSSITKEIIVTDDSPANNPPWADFMVNKIVGDLSTEFIFDANFSTDQEDPTADLKVRWDWENDLIWDTEFSTAKVETISYSTAGVKTIKLEVEDTGGLRSSVTQQLTVTDDTAPNTSPSAFFTVIDISDWQTSSLYFFDAMLCSDNEDPLSALKVRWDWENDGIWDTDFKYFKVDSHFYEIPGITTVKMEVEDTGGLRDWATEQITVDFGHNNTSASKSTAEKDKR